MDRFDSLEALERGFRDCGYVAGRELLTPLYLMTRLERPLLLEGHAGVGKTETAKVLARLLDTELIRLQCYEGLDAANTLYEWNYQKQLLAIRMHEGVREQGPDAPGSTPQAMDFSMSPNSTLTG